MYLSVPKFNSAYSENICSRVISDDDAIQPFESDMSNQPQAVQTAYGLYRQAVATYQQNLRQLPTTCRTDNQSVRLPLLKSVEPAVMKIIDFLSSAYDTLPH